MIIIAANSQTSLLVSLTLLILVAASMQLFKAQLSSSQVMTLVGGFMGSLLFIFGLTVSKFSNHLRLTLILGLTDLP